MACSFVLCCRYAKLKKTSYKVVSEKLGDDNYSVTYSFPTAEVLADFQTWCVVTACCCYYLVQGRTPHALVTPSDSLSIAYQHSVMYIYSVCILVWPTSGSVTLAEC